MSVAAAQDFFFQWHLTERCNLRCSHCYQGENRPGRDPLSSGARRAAALAGAADASGRPGGLDELTTAEVRDVLAEMAETLDAWSDLYGLAFEPGLTLTGGEPLLRSDLLAIVEAAAEQGFAVSLLTNGVLVDRAMAGRLAEAGVESVQVSLEGPEPLHERMRGAGSFAAAVRGARALVEAGLEVSLNATLSRLNAAGFPELVGLGKEIGVKRVGFSRLVPAGRGKGLETLGLDTAEVETLYRSIASMAAGLAASGMTLGTSDPLAARLLWPSAEGGATDGADEPDGQAPSGRNAGQGASRAEEAGQAASSAGRPSANGAKQAAPPQGDPAPCGSVPLGGCSAGVSGLTILADGTIVPCRRLSVPIGNVRTDSLREVWATSDVLEALRDKSRYDGKCGACRRWNVCRGCRAMAWAVTGNFLAGDPNCFYQA